LEAVAAARGNNAMKRSFTAKLLQRTADPRNLRLAWDHLATYGGPSPGVDGLRPGDLADHEVWDLLRTLRQVILSDTYRTAPDRKVPIPKSSGKGTRTLSIPSLIDRVVQRAVVQVVQPYLDNFLGDHCLGYRPGVGINDALALAEQSMVAEDRWVVLAEDLRNAFDHVPQRRLLDVLGKYLDEEKSVKLLGRLVRTTTGKGLRQGGNLSPLLLNVYLHHFLDRKWRRLHPDVVLIRWADDLLVLCRTRTEAIQAHEDLERLLRPAGMQVKGTPERTVHDLSSGAAAEWLGYRLSKGVKGLKVRIAEGAWRSLTQHLEDCHRKDESPLRAIDTIRGWVDSLGPCFRWTDISKAYARIGATARELAFDEMPTIEEVRHLWRNAYLRWCRCRKVGKGARGEQADGSARRDTKTGRHVPGRDGVAGRR
jgi:RNA-directed DNA polymerase